MDKGYLSCTKHCPIAKFVISLFLFEQVNDWSHQGEYLRRLGNILY